MKTLMTLSLFVTMSSFTTIQSFIYQSAIHPSETKASSDLFVRFDAHRFQKGVALSWTVDNAQDVAGYMIERSYDGFYFDVVDELQAPTSNSVRYTDTDVYPGYLYYRVTAIMNDATTTVSATEMVRIVRNG